MKTTYVLLSVYHDEKVNPSNLSEVKDYEVIEYEEALKDKKPYISF
tara:strand:+ start:692 stop:829 length:138 start_codon:yes stop_codon:yes gene_type:complete